MSQDEYAKPVKPRERNNRTDTMGAHRTAFTKSGDSIMAILSRLRVSYDGDRTPLRITNEFWPDGSPLALFPDARVHDGRYWDGVFEVDGSVHKTHGGRKWDEKKDAHYEKMGLWVERIPANEVSEEKIREALERHARKVDSYRGAV